MDVNDDREDYDIEFRPVVTKTTGAAFLTNKKTPVIPVPIVARTPPPPPPPPPNSLLVSDNETEDEEEEELSENGEEKDFVLLIEQVKYLQCKLNKVTSEFKTHCLRQRAHNFGLLALFLGWVYIS